MNASNARAPLMRPRTGWCSSGSPANDSSSASGSPASKPSKYGTATSSSRRRFSSSRSSAGAVNSSGIHGIRQASHTHRAQGARRRAPSRAGGLEELDRVAGGVLEQDLPPAGPGDDVVAECQAGGAQAVDLIRDVLDDEVDAVPAARLRGAPVGHG